MFSPAHPIAAAVPAQVVALADGGRLGGLSARRVEAPLGTPASLLLPAVMFPVGVEGYKGGLIVCVRAVRVPQKDHVWHCPWEAWD